MGLTICWEHRSLWVVRECKKAPKNRSESRIGCEGAAKGAEYTVKSSLVASIIHVWERKNS